MWLPDWRTTTKPSLSSARTICAPDNPGNLGMRNFECRYQRVSVNIHWKFFQVKTRSFLEILYRFSNCFTLSGSPGFRIQCDKSAFFGGS